MGAHLKLLLFFTLFFLNSVPARSLTESEALIDLRSSLGISSRNWHKRKNPCSNWTGIQCTNGHVTRINLSGLRRTRKGKANPQFAVDSLPNFTYLSSFNSSGFSLPGPIPGWLGYRLSNLQVLDLRSSSIFGSIPSSIGSLSRLSCLYLSNNSIAGSIPPALGNLSSLSVLDLSLNLLTGQIPSEVSSLGSLSELDLSSNFLSGGIPVEFGLFSSSLKYLNLSINSLSGSIPAQLGKLSGLGELDLGYNSLSGPLPVEIGGLANLSKMIVANNLLEGTLLRGVFRNLTRLVYLDFSSNNLTGFLPNMYSNFSGSVFNISNNYFYGNLSSGLRNFHVVDVSNNYLQGLAPNDDSKFSIILMNNCFSGPPDQRYNDDCVNFYSDRGLSFVNIGPQDQPTIQRAGGVKRLMYVMIGVFGGLGLMIVLITSSLLVLRSCGMKRRNQKSEGVLPKDLSDVSGPGVSYTYEQMRLATCNFSTGSLIKQGRSGDLFKGELEGGGPAVVVKRVDLRSGTRNESEFVSELELLGKMVHRRLVPVLGHCMEDEYEKFLVYKYMLNGDLSSALYKVMDGEESLQSLDWITRLKIAIGAAEGLSYLHHECSPPLVHRDIQASSILLDDKYEVRLGSLSEVCVPGAISHQNVITRLLRSPQSSGRRPSGSVASLTFAHDVYCFGKVLLELVTGKLSISSPSDTRAKQWLDTNLSFISIHEKELITKIVDQSLMIDDDLLEEVWAVAIVAKSCLNPRASRRPSMRHVFKALENPFKVVRGESFSIDRLRAVSSRQSWTAAIFGSWHHSSSGSSNASSQKNKEIIDGLKRAERVGSRSSGGNEHSTSHKRSSSEVFPEPSEVQDDVC